MIFNNLISKKLLIIILAGIFVLNIVFVPGCSVALKKQQQENIELWNAYNEKTSALFSDYKERIKSLDSKFMGALLAYDYSLVGEISSEIIITYDKYLEALNLVLPPVFAETLHNYQVKSISLEREKWLGISQDYKLYVQENEELKEEILDTINNIQSERQRIIEILNPGT